MMIIITLLILGLIIFLHELGHFATAKYYGMPVSEFSIGMGPLIFQKEYNDTKYSLRILPLGGYVSIDGMIVLEKDDKEAKNMSLEEIDEYNKKGFNSYSWNKKLVVLLAGIFMNFLSAIIVFFILGLINEYGILDSLKLAISNFVRVFIMVFKSIYLLISGASSTKNLVGPVGLPAIFKSEVVKHGYIALLSIFSFLSVNIGIMNLLPIPALDGGRVVFVLLDKIGLKLNKKIEEKIHLIFMILLFLLMIYVFYNDIVRIIKGA